MPKALCAQQARRLTDIPNIGTSIAADLRGAGVQEPADVQCMDPVAVYERLRGPMGRRHDPCVLPRAVPIVEAMAAITLLDLFLMNK